MGDIVDDNFYKIFNNYNLDFETKCKLRDEVKDYIAKNFEPKARA